MKGSRFGASETMRPTFRSRLAQPSRRLPMPGAKESSTLEWHSAHWVPSDVILPPLSNLPVNPSTALSWSNASVVAGSSRLTLPALICAFTCSGSASTSTFRPTARAVFGLTPAPTPPFFSPAMALCRPSASPKKASEPKVSKRKICLPSSIKRRACALIWRSFLDRLRSRSSSVDSPAPASMARAMADTPMTEAAAASLIKGPLFALRVRQIGDEVGALLRIRHAGIGHGGAGHRAERIGQEALEVLLRPRQLRLLHCVGVIEPGHAARAAADQAAVARPDAVVGERMAGEAARIDRLACLRVARRQRGDEQRAFQHYETNAEGTGFSPSALRRMAQCIASSPRMLAAAFDRSRLAKSGTAPR